MKFLDWIFQSDEKEDASADWPTVTAEVHNAHSRGGRGSYVAEISYFYNVQGEYYSGYMQHECFSDEVYDFVSRFPKGHKIVVHYCPTKPEISTFREEDWDRVN